MAFSLVRGTNLASPPLDTDSARVCKDDLLVKAKSVNGSSLRSSARGLEMLRRLQFVQRRWSHFVVHERNSVVTLAAYGSCVTSRIV